MDKTIKTPNPQGKGGNATLALFQSFEQIHVPKKTENQILKDFFTTEFILSSRFKFNPIRGQAYHLYYKNKNLQLSLISPVEWGEKIIGVYVGLCKYHSDLTWSLELSNEAKESMEIMNYIENEFSCFEKKVKSIETANENLPFYRHDLPFYQRVLSAAMAQSLSKSIRLLKS